MSGPEELGAGRAGAGGLLAAYRVPAGPVESPPGGAPIPPGVRRLLLGEALAGVALGDHDRRVLDRLAYLADEATVRTLLGLLLRARAAGPLGGGGR